MPEEVRKTLKSKLGLPDGIPETGADSVFVLGEYDCGNLSHEFSSRLIRFKDLKGIFGRGTDERRHYQGYFAGLLADMLLEKTELEEYVPLVPVPPKLGQDPAGYHLFDLAIALKNELEKRGAGEKKTVLFDSLRFTGEIPPVKDIELPKRPCALKSRIACTATFSGQSVVLLDDIIASGATSAECVRALREAGAVRVALLALARRIA